MKRYSVVPSSTRRKSTLHDTSEELTAAREELEKLEQETTLVLQEIDKNISRGNAVINDRLIPVIKEYAQQSQKVWDNAGFWKYFFELSANVELTCYDEPITTDTDVNTIANSKNILYEDPDSSDERNSKKPPKVQLEDSTPTWTERRQQQSSTPQMNKKPTFLPAPVFDSNDSSIRIQPPHLKENSPSRTYTQTIRKSLDTYQRVSISPRKTPLNDRARRRSSIIQELLNSSPTLPEPPILRSELAYSSLSPRSRDAPQSIPSLNVRPLSPVILPPELSPIKAHHNSDTIQRFPTTPKFSDRLSGGNATSGVFNADDSDLAPPVLQREIRSEHSFEEEIPAPPNLQTIELQRKRQKTDRQKSDNVFLDKPPSAGSTIFHSIIASSDSGHVSNLFEDVTKKVAGTQPRTGLPVLAKDIFSEVQDPSIDLTEMGTELQKRYNRLSGRIIGSEEGNDL